jgi:peptidoglycan/xylan/chitin deacetylase (PgdA/CDA1 family)
VQREGCDSLAELASVIPAGSVVDGPWPRPAVSAESIGGIAAEAAGGTIHLGFDVEGDPAPVTAILDVLDEHGVKTTFFVLGQWAESNPQLMREIVARGHELANHAYRHDPLGPAGDAQIIDELTRTEDVVLAITGVSTKPFFRPPFGDRTENSVGVAAEAGWTTVHWSGGAGDFVEGATIDSMCGSLLSSSSPGAVLLAHTFNPLIPDVLDRYIRQLHRDGLVVVPLSVLLTGEPESYIVRP